MGGAGQFGRRVYLWSSGPWLGVCGTPEAAQGAAEEHLADDAVVEAARVADSHRAREYERTGSVWRPQRKPDGGVWWTQSEREAPPA